jgi:Protein of unknown function (DUF1517)
VFNWLGKKKYVVASLMVGLDGQVAAPLLGVLNQASRTILEADGEFETASREVAAVCSALFDYEMAWSRSANWGEVFNKEEEAGDYGAESFSDLSQRYLSGSAGDDSVAVIPSTARASQNIVVMVTVAYMGKVEELETSITSAQQLKAALKAIISLHHKDQLQLAHLHYAPAHFGDDLDEDQLLINYPELVAL